MDIKYISLINNRLKCNRKKLQGTENKHTIDSETIIDSKQSENIVSINLVSSVYHPVKRVHIS